MTRMQTKCCECQWNAAAPARPRLHRVRLDIAAGGVRGEQREEQMLRGSFAIYLSAIMRSAQSSSGGKPSRRMASQLKERGTCGHVTGHPAHNPQHTYLCTCKDAFAITAINFYAYIAHFPRKGFSLKWLNALFTACLL